MRPFLLVLLALVAAPDAHRAQEELKSILRAIRQAEDAETRIQLVERLVVLDTSASAGLLARIVRTDVDPEVRVAAAKGLGRMRADSVPKLLRELVLQGGPREVREAIGDSLAGREDGAAVLLELLADRKTDALGKGLVIQAFTRFRDEATLLKLLDLAAEKDAHLRGEALLVLRSRPAARERLVAGLGEILRKSRGKESLLQALDLIEDLEDVAMLPLVAKLATFLEPEVRVAAGHLEEKLKYLQAVGRARRAVLEGYGVPPVPPEPPVRARFDLVFAIDVTGSTVTALSDLRKRIRLEIRLLERLGCSVRVGIVGYRFWKNISLHVPRQEILPLTHDREKVEAFLEELKSRGPDSQGADVTNGLHQALDRMGWRWNAQRFVVLMSDSRCHDANSARLVTGVHFRADRTRTRVLYVLRTRRSIPEEMSELARLGGTGLVELLE